MNDDEKLTRLQNEDDLIVVEWMIQNENGEVLAVLKEYYEKIGLVTSVLTVVHDFTGKEEEVSIYEGDQYKLVMEKFNQYGKTITTRPIINACAFCGKTPSVYRDQISCKCGIATVTTGEIPKLIMYQQWEAMRKMATVKSDNLLSANIEYDRACFYQKLNKKILPTIGKMSTERGE